MAAPPQGAAPTYPDHHSTTRINYCTPPGRPAGGARSLQSEYRAKICGPAKKRPGRHAPPSPPAGIDVARGRAPPSSIPSSTGEPVPQEGRAMAALHTYLDDLLAVLRTAAGLH